MKSFKMLNYVLECIIWEFLILTSHLKARTSHAHNANFILAHIAQRSISTLNVFGKRSPACASYTYATRPMIAH